MENREQYQPFLTRTELLLGPKAIDRLRKSAVLVAGLGGTGGAQAVTLARMGIGRFVLADPCTFAPPDVNRQWAADASTMGQNKAEVYAKWLGNIIPGTRVEVHPEGVTEQNVEALVGKVDLVCDNLDVKVDLSLRARMLDLARRRGIYSTSCPILGFGAFLAVASPVGCSMEPLLAFLEQVTERSEIPDLFREIHMPQHINCLERNSRNGLLPTVSLAPLISASLCATEVTLILLRGQIEPWREPLVLPQVVMMDLFRGTYQVRNIEELKEH